MILEGFVVFQLRNWNIFSKYSPNMSYVFDIDCKAHRWVSLWLAQPALVSKITAALTII